MFQSKAQLLIAVSSVAITALAASPSLAQSTDTSAKASGAPALEEIVVTSDRKNSYSADLVQAGSFRGGRQIDTPLTISVIPQQVIQTQQAAGLLDALRNTAGVTSSQTAPTVYNNLAIRGINVDNRGNYRLNGSLPIVNLIDLPLEDKDRVEALKGASALYYGFTTPSGIINMTMKRPTLSPYLQMDVSGNNFGAFGGHVDASGTSGMFGARINLAYNHVDPGIDHTDGPRELIAGAFDFKPLDNLTFSLDLEHISKQVNEPGVYRFTTPPASTVANPYPSIALPPLISQKINFGPTWARNRAVEDNVLGHISWKITDAWNAILDVGSSHEARDRVSSTLNPTNFATGEGTLAILMQPDARYTNRNIRSELAGAFATGPISHELLIGASENKRALFTSDTIAATCPGATPTAARVTCTQNFFNPRPIPQTPLPTRTGVASDIDDKGLYLFEKAKLGEWLQVLAGVRKSDYQERNLTTGVTTSKLSPTSYSYGVVLKPRSWASAYVTYIEGLENTPLAPVTAVNAGAQLPATASKQKEAGIKIEPRHGLLFQAAYFDIDRASTFVNGVNVYVQDGRAQYRGEEFSLTGEITPQLSVYASALFLDAKQASGAATVVTTNSTTGVTTVSPTLVGRRIENTAKVTYSIAGEYRLDNWIDGLSVNAGAFYTGARAIDPLNRALAPAYTLFDLGVAYRREMFDHMTTFRVNGQNVTDKRYFASTGQDLLAQGTPRTVKFSISSVF